MDFDCLFWKYCLGTISIILLFCVVILSILLFCSRRKTLKIESTAKKLALENELEHGETESKDQQLDVLKIPRKQGTPLTSSKGDNLEHYYETITPKESKLLTARDSVGERLKKKILKRKGRKKAVTFESDRFEYIPGSSVQMISEKLEERPQTISDIVNELPVDTNKPSTSGPKDESTYMIMHGSKKSEAEVNPKQAIEKSKEKSHVYKKCKKSPQTPRGSRVTKLQKSKKTKNLTITPAASTYENHHIEYLYNNQNNLITDAGIFNKVCEDGGIVNMVCEDGGILNTDCEDVGIVNMGCEDGGILITDCEDEFDEDEMYNKEMEKYARLSACSRGSNITRRASEPKFKEKGNKPNLPKKISTKSESRISNFEHRTVDVQNESGNDATSVESYDVPPAPPRPVKLTSSSGNELFPSTPWPQDYIPWSIANAVEKQ